MSIYFAKVVQLGVHGATGTMPFMICIKNTDFAQDGVLNISFVVTHRLMEDPVQLTVQAATVLFHICSYFKYQYV